VFEKLKTTSESLIRDSENISEERKNLLAELALYIKGNLNSGKGVHLVFICTHNSRRSHLAQIWAQTAAHYFCVKNIHTYSGGTQTTAFNSAVVNAPKNVGFKIKVVKEARNPKYQVRFSKKADPLICFSKHYNHKKNPNEGFVAVMTCSDADEACPVVEGARYRTTLKYDDPKKYDGTEGEAAAYAERTMQIGREMFYVFGLVAGR
jgi:arsenate reductase (thioredoxin)